MIDQTFEKLIDLLAEESGLPRQIVKQAIEDRAKCVALPSSQAAISKAEAKRQRKAAALQRQQGVA